MNKLLLRKSTIGIIETAHYPAKFYAGFIQQNGNEWIPSHNDTCFFHRSLESANRAFDKLDNALSSFGCWV